MRAVALNTFFALSVFASRAAAQLPVDSALASYIAGIRAVDAHAHPMRPVAPGAPADTEFDVLPLDGIPPFAVPWRLRPENPEWLAAQHAMAGLASTDTSVTDHKTLMEAVARIARQQGEHYPDWVLDKVGTEVMLANRVAMGPGLDPSRFRWVSFVDALMLPLDTRAEASRTPDVHSLYPRETTLLHRYLRDLGRSTIPPTLDGFVQEVIVPTLARQRGAGAVSVKFEAAYLRPLDFNDPDTALAQRVYARYAAGGTPTHAEYKALQDDLFRIISREAGRLGMSVQIHVLSQFGGFYSATGSTPRMLEPAFNDSTLRGTNFVIVHGGWPLVDETQGLLGKPNVYADISMMVLIAEPARVAAVLRQWLTEWPEKVLFGTDAFDNGPEQNWGMVAYLGTTSARRALAVALTGMMRDGEIDRTRAESLARMVMRENASHAYHLGLRLTSGAAHLPGPIANLLGSRQIRRMQTDQWGQHTWACVCVVLATGPGTPACSQ